MDIKESEWSEPAPPDGGINSFYDYVKCRTQLGYFKIEWKSWKEYDSYCLYFNGDYITSLDTLEEAKQAACTYFKNKFEYWYITLTESSEEEMKATLEINEMGNYKVNQTYWMYKAFLAGQALRGLE